MEKFQKDIDEMIALAKQNATLTERNRIANEFNNLPLEKLNWSKVKEILFPEDK